MALIAGRFADAYPLATLTAVVLFALLAVPFWFFVSELDFLEREPPALLALAFAWGGLVATAVSIPGSAALDNLIAKLGSPHLAADWGAALAGPTVEEIAKTLGVVAIVLIARAQVNSVLDGVVYGAMVGLGFQIVEDIVYALGAVALAGRGDHVAAGDRHVPAARLPRRAVEPHPVRRAGRRRHRLPRGARRPSAGGPGSASRCSPCSAPGPRTCCGTRRCSRDGLGNGALAPAGGAGAQGPAAAAADPAAGAPGRHDREADYYAGQLATLRRPRADHRRRARGAESGLAAGRRPLARAAARGAAGPGSGTPVAARPGPAGGRAQPRHHRPGPVVCTTIRRQRRHPGRAWVTRRRSHRRARSWRRPPRRSAPRPSRSPCSGRLSARSAAADGDPWPAGLRRSAGGRRRRRRSCPGCRPRRGRPS